VKGKSASLFVCGGEDRGDRIGEKKGVIDAALGGQKVDAAEVREKSSLSKSLKKKHKKKSAKSFARGNSRPKRGREDKSEAQKKKEG